MVHFTTVKYATFIRWNDVFRKQEMEAKRRKEEEERRKQDEIDRKNAVSVNYLYQHFSGHAV